MFLEYIIPDLEKNLLENDYDSGDEAIMDGLNFYGSDIVNGSELDMKKALGKIEWIDRYLDINKYGNVVMKSTFGKDDIEFYQNNYPHENRQVSSNVPNWTRFRLFIKFPT
jgi:hypothetical protein